MKRINALDKFQINVNALSKTEKYIYKNLSKKFSYEHMKELFKTIIFEQKFSEIFLKDFFSVLFSIDNYDFKIMTFYHDTYFPEKDDFSFFVETSNIRSSIFKTLEYIVLKKPDLQTFDIEKIMFATLITYLEKSTYHSRLRYPKKLKIYIEDKTTNEYLRLINLKNNNLEFILSLIDNELQKEAEILNRNPKLDLLFQN